MAASTAGGPRCWQLAGGDAEAHAELDNVDGVGPALIEQLSEFFAEPHNIVALDELAAELEIEAPAPDRVARLAACRQDHRVHRHAASG